MLTYFGTTTLTTIGLGDIHPISNFERIICTFYMFIGVAMFSFIFSKVDNSISKIRQIYSPMDEEQNKLEQFFGVLKWFNGNYPIPKNLRVQIEKYFEFRWEKDPT